MADVPSELNLTPPQETKKYIICHNIHYIVREGWIGDKPCYVTVQTGSYVTVERPHIAARRSESHPNQRFTLHAVSAKVFPVLKEVFLDLNLRRCPLKIWSFVSNVTNEFMSELDKMRTYISFVDLCRQTLRLEEEDISQRSPVSRPRSSRQVVAKDQVIGAQCEKIVMVKLESPTRSRKWNDRIEPAGPSA